MMFKSIPPADARRIATLPLDYEWDTTIGNGFLAAREEAGPRLSDALETLDIHGAADLVLGAVEWCFARVHDHVDPTDGRHRLQAAWAATVDPRYALLVDKNPADVGPDSAWSLPEWQARGRLGMLGSFLSAGRSSKVRQVALGALLMAEHLCGRDPAFGTWLTDTLRAKAASSPRRADDVDAMSRDTSLATAGALTLPSRDERLADLDPTANPYLRAAADMVALGFAGDPYPSTSRP